MFMLRTGSVFQAAITWLCSALFVLGRNLRLMVSFWGDSLVELYAGWRTKLLVTGFINGWGTG